jgi:hypothetical protein
MLSATEKQAALGRIGCAGMQGRTSAWKIADWFVRLARNQNPFRDMAHVEVESLRQEYRALQEELTKETGRFNQDTVSVEALETFRSAVRHHLEQLADAGQTQFGPFTLTRSIYMPRHNTSSARVLDKQVYSGDFVEPCDGQGLLYYLSGLLGQIGLAILRCPYCTHIFLRARADAEHCSRRCQANAYTRGQREADKAEKAEKAARKGRRGKTKPQHSGPTATRKRNPPKLSIKARAAVPRKPSKQKPARKSK